MTGEQAIEMINILSLNNSLLNDFVIMLKIIIGLISMDFIFKRLKKGEV